MGETPLRTYTAEVQEVHSGDDLVLMVDLGVSNLHTRVRARLHGVDTPDGYREEGCSDAGRVREEVKQLVKGRSCRVDLHSERKSGWIVTLHVPSNANGVLFSLNQYLIDKGYVFKGITKSNVKTA